MFRTQLSALDHLWRGGKGWILTSVAFGWFLSLGVRLVFPALAPHLRSDFGVSLTSIGLLLTVLWLAYAVGQFPGGMVGDRFGEGNILVWSTLLAAGAVFVVTFSSNVAMFAVATALFGVSTALYGPTRFTILSDVYSDRDGIAVGITMAIGNVGNALLPVIAVFLASYYSWRLGFGVTVPLFVLATVAIRWAVPKRTSPPSTDSIRLSIDTLADIGTIVLERKTILLAIVLLLNTFIIQSFTSFYPTYLIDSKSLSTELSGVLYGLFFSFGIVVQPVSGACRDRFGTRPTLLGFFLLLTGGLFALPTLSHIYALVGVTILLSAVLGVAPTALTQLVNSLPAETQGSSLGLVRTVYMMIASTGPGIIGAFANAGYFDEAFVLLGCLAAIGFLLTLVSIDT